MPRKATGTLVRTKDGYAARVPVVVGDVDGKPVREKRWYPLETHSRALARAKLARIVAQVAAGAAPSVEAASLAETAAHACERVHEQRLAAEVTDAKGEIARLRAFAFPLLGDLQVTEIGTAEVNEVLDACKAQGRARGTVQHLKQDLRNVFAVLKREGALAANPVDEAELPTFVTVVTKERQVLTDAELAAYLAWEHPEEKWQLATLERQTMACVARMFGGLRTGDLHALRWEAFDVAGKAEFKWGYAPRQKTKQPQLLEVPSMLRPILRDWWERAGRPASGVLFPSRRGERAGEQKRKASHADAFRRDLLRAFGVEVPKVVVQKRKNGRPLTRLTWRRARALTSRERQIFEESAFTLPVDFHSWRRAFSQALADADVNVQQATALAGHSTLDAHQRYLASSGKLRRLPDAALPRLTVETFGHNPCPNDAAPIAYLQSGWQDLNLQQPAPKGEAIAETTEKDAIAVPSTAPLYAALRQAVSDRRVRTSDPQRLPVGERAATLAVVRRIRAMLPEQPHQARELAVELERDLEAAGSASDDEAGTA